MGAFVYARKGSLASHFLIHEILFTHTIKGPLFVPRTVWISRIPQSRHQQHYPDHSTLPSLDTSLRTRTRTSHSFSRELLLCGISSSSLFRLYYYSKKDQQVVVVGSGRRVVVVLQKQMADQEDHHWGIHLDYTVLQALHIIQTMLRFCDKPTATLPD